MGQHNAEQRRGRGGGCWRARRILAGATAGLAALWLLGGSAAAAHHHKRHHGRHHAHHAAAAGVPSEWIVIDAENGRVLSEQNADTPTYAASLTKMMTLYLTFEALDTGRLRLDQSLPVSALAASQPPTRLGLKPGERVSVHDLILAMITRSANDAAVVVAEALAGSEAGFARLMTEKARQLGMANTIFVNANGLPDPGQHTTARDMARLALALYRDFPREYHYFATKQFEFDGQTIRTHNHLLDSYPGADGIKTGYIRASGFNLAASAVRDGHRLIGVVMGGPSVGARDREMAGLLDRGFAEVGAPTSAVARNEPRHAPPPSPAPAAPKVTAVAEHRDHRTGLDRLTARIAAHLTPVTHAEAAPFRHVDRSAPAGERWAVQLGAFRKEAGAEKVARKAAALQALRGKPLQVVGPHQVGHDRMYRARLLNFSHRSAERACAALRKKKIACTVVPATPINYAAGD